MRREDDYAICRAYDCGLADHGRGRKLEASPYSDRGLTEHWQRGWRDASRHALVDRLKRQPPQNIGEWKRDDLYEDQS